MAVPRRSSGAGILGKPTTGLPSNVLIGARIVNINDYQFGDGSTESRYAYLIWQLRIEDPNLVGFIDSNKRLWIWVECNQRWWSPNIEGTTIRSGGSSFVSDSQGIPPTSDASLNDLTDNTSREVTGQTGRIENLTWSSYDNINQTWITRSELCEREDRPEEPPLSDCEKYGINCPPELGSGKVYTLIDDEDKLSQRAEIKTYGIWSNNVGNLTTFHTCSLSGSVQPYHNTIYDDVCDSCGSEPQFDIAYGHVDGSGSLDLGGRDYMTPTNAIYSQYRLLCVGAESEYFKIGSKNLKQIYVINVKRARMQERLDEGNIELNLAHLSGSEFVAGGNPLNAHTGSNVTLSGNGQVLRLIDDSILDFNQLSTSSISGSYSDFAAAKAHRVGNGGEVYYMVSGSIERGIHTPSDPKIYGMLYPRLGVIVLDADKLDATASFGSVTGTEIAGRNADKIFTSISGAAQYTDVSGDVKGFQARRKETEHAEYYFIRVKNSDYNFTNNPTYQTGSLGEINGTFTENPVVYFTSIGLYNQRKELLAVGKVTRPIQKTSTSEALFRVRLKY